MIPQSFTGDLGFKTRVLGTLSNLSYAFALVDGIKDQDSHTHANRMGWYADRTTNSEAIHTVVFGTVRFSVTRTGASVVGNLTVSGDVYISGLSYDWPTANSLGFLKNDGSGNLTWAAIPSDSDAATASLRTLGTSANQAAAGNHSHSVFDATNAGFVPAPTTVTGKVLSDSGWTTVATSVATGNVLWVDAVNGNDTSGTRGKLDKPYLTIAEAVNDALTNDVIVVLPGSYPVTTNLWTTKNLSFFFHPNTTVNCSGTIPFNSTAANMTLSIYGDAKFVCNGVQFLYISAFDGANVTVFCRNISCTNATHAIYSTVNYTATTNIIVTENISLAPSATLTVPVCTVALNHCAVTNNEVNQSYLCAGAIYYNGGTNNSCSALTLSSSTNPVNVSYHTVEVNNLIVYLGGSISGNTNGALTLNGSYSTLQANISCQNIVGGHTAIFDNMTAPSSVNIKSNLIRAGYCVYYCAVNSAATVRINSDRIYCNVYGNSQMIYLSSNGRILVINTNSVVTTSSTSTQNLIYISGGCKVHAFINDLDTSLLQLSNTSRVIYCNSGDTNWIFNNVRCRCGFFEAYNGQHAVTANTVYILSDYSLTNVCVGVVSLNANLYFTLGYVYLNSSVNMPAYGFYTYNGNGKLMVNCGEMQVLSSNAESYCMKLSTGDNRINVRKLSGQRIALISGGAVTYLTCDEMNATYEAITVNNSTAKVYVDSKRIYSSGTTNGTCNIQYGTATFYNAEIVNNTNSKPAIYQSMSSTCEIRNCKLTTMAPWHCAQIDGGSTLRAYNSVFIPFTGYNAAITTTTGTLACLTPCSATAPCGSTLTLKVHALTIDPSIT